MIVLYKRKALNKKTAFIVRAKQYQKTVFTKVCSGINVEIVEKDL